MTAAEILVACVRCRAKLSRVSIDVYFADHTTKSQALPSRAGNFEELPLSIRGCIVIATDKSKAKANKMSADIVHESAPAPASASAKIVCLCFVVSSIPRLRPARLIH